MFNASTVDEAFWWNNIGTICSVFTAISLFHFSVTFCKLTHKIRPFLLSAIYGFGTLLIILEFTTTTLTKNMKPSFWGYGEIPGSFFYLLYLFIIGLVISSLILFLRRYQSSAKKKPKIRINIAPSIETRVSVICIVRIEENASVSSISTRSPQPTLDM